MGQGWVEQGSEGSREESESGLGGGGIGSVH